jgi:hypothetical protein
MKSMQTMLQKPVVATTISRMTLNKGTIKHNHTKHSDTQYNVKKQDSQHK